MASYGSSLLNALYSLGASSSNPNASASLSQNANGDISLSESLSIHNSYSEDDRISLSSIGDWGEGDVVHSGVAKWVTENAKDGVLLLGDNFYPVGVTSVNDPQFKLFENGFQAQDPNRHKTKYYVVLGNHDYYGNVNAQVDYSRINQHWILPSLYYSHTFVSKSSNVRVHMIIVDTWRLNGGDGAFHKYRNPTEPDAEQYEWLERELSSEVARAADWVIVVGHFPLESSILMPRSGLQNLEERLTPLLKKYRVDAYIHGHDHILQHIESDGLHHFGSGAGAKKFYFVNQFYPGLKSVKCGRYGYMEHEFTKTTFKTTIFYAKRGQKLISEEHIMHKQSKISLQ